MPSEKWSSLIPKLLIMQNKVLKHGTVEIKNSRFNLIFNWENILRLNIRRPVTKKINFAKFWTETKRKWKRENFLKSKFNLKIDPGAVA